MNAVETISTLNWFDTIRKYLTLCHSPLVCIWLCVADVTVWKQYLSFGAWLSDFTSTLMSEGLHKWLQPESSGSLDCTRVMLPKRELKSVWLQHPDSCEGGSLFDATYSTWLPGCSRCDLLAGALRTPGVTAWVSVLALGFKFLSRAEGVRGAFPWGTSVFLWLRERDWEKLKGIGLVQVLFFCTLPWGQMENKSLCMWHCCYW